MCGWIYDEALGVPEEGIAQVQPGRMFQKTGLVQSVVPAKKILR